MLSGYSACAGLGDGLGVDVGGKDLDVEALPIRSRASSSRMARETASSPVAQPGTQTRMAPPVSFRGHDLGDNLGR